MDDRHATTRLEITGFADAVHGRASVRRFLPDPVPREDVTAMVATAVRAANAGNAQGWRFVVVEDDDLKVAMRDAVDAAVDALATAEALAGRVADVKAFRAYATFFAAAPAVVAVFSLPYASRGDELLAATGADRETHDRLRARPDLQSVGAAVQLLCTAAHAMGYGGCWMTAPVIAAPAIEALLGVAEPARLVAVVPIGRPAGPVEPTLRRPVEDVLEFR